MEPRTPPQVTPGREARRPVPQAAARRPDRRPPPSRTGGGRRAVAPSQQARSQATRKVLTVGVRP
ncbi:hypothetical protein SCATT_31020 [Streptantibioticus cattleyicolor NRRL 8057 = DSM 46488]|uniref:Uncharacterized protein n=1 Tax=Streptantibioticus cattleyicolor (strain ATCC 35852 / DSM 46488 / JCM 4925 / NBRC 14057 / NRRL 8057) TaxID=1003195 RepID=G8WWW0_STREN|nr:hypothetical protein SCATT_31020 [Streptantibioticus cattleyicolor NRRL 8057 = DSM 46488]